MFIDFFDWLCDSLSSVFEVMKRFTLFEGFTYYHFCIGLLATTILFKILKLIMLIEDEEAHYGPSQPESNGNYMPQFDGYTPRHFKTYKPRHGIYQPRHEKKKRGWF